MSDEFTIDAKLKASNLVAEHRRYEQENAELRSALEAALEEARGYKAALERIEDTAAGVGISSSVVHIGECAHEIHDLARSALVSGGRE